MTATVIPAVPLRHSLDQLSIPLLGLGAAAVASARPATKQAVLDAIELGYRHIDTAAVYLTEEAVGEAVAEAIERRFICSRDDLFITSKLWSSDASPELVIPALRRTLQKLGTNCVDLYLIHWPVRSAPGKLVVPIEVGEILPLDLPAVWAAMEECQRFGLTKAIGVSNFSCKKLDELLQVAKIPPAVNQVEMNPLWQQKELREYCKQKGIHITAYSPLGGQLRSSGENRVLANDLLKRIAHIKGKTVAQICLRWAYEQGVSAVPKSFNRERMEENMQIFNWELTHEENNLIAGLAQEKSLLMGFSISGELTPMLRDMIANDMM